MTLVRRGAVRSVLAFVGLVGVVLATFALTPMAAHAAGPNAAVSVSDVTITPADTQATVGDTLTVSGSWDASAADPQPGDTFTIGLPAEFGFPSNVPFTLVGPNGNGDTVTWGNCLTDATTGVATCTLTDAVVEHPELVKGTFQFQVKAIEATEETDVTFDLNGKDVVVPLPGGGGIDDGIAPPAGWDKSGVMNSNHWSVGWTINLPGDRLQGHDVVNVGEVLSDNHQLCDPSGLKVVAIRGSTTTDVTSIAQVVAGADDQHFTIRLTQPDSEWDAKTTYRITYNTCTPDDRIDPVGTVYTNDATVDIWGESSGDIGVTQDWDFQGSVSKSGSVLGGANRDGKIAWTVTADGDVLNGKTSFPFNETLSGDQALCGDTLSGLTVIQQYGPGGSQQTDVTGDLNVTASATTATSFDATISIKSGSSFAFKGHPYIYVIKYNTCVTTDGLPEGGQAFGNTASIDGFDAGATATVPTRTDQKNGSINTSAVTLDGVQYLPQTTMNWSITVPGEDLQDVNSALAVTDTLSDSQTVCAGSGGSVASRLGLKVQAIDQVNGGGLSTVDLTSSTTADAQGNDLTFSIPEPTLTQPGGGTVTGFSREYQYVISYTTCTISGGMDAPGTTYGNTATVNGKTYSKSLTQSNSGSGTGQGVSRGSVAITKSLADSNGTAFVPANTMFTVHVKEVDPTGVVRTEYDLQVPLNGDPVSGFNARGTGWKIELSEPTFPSVPGVTWGAPMFQASDGVVLGDGGTTATATISPATNIRIALKNTAELGSLKVTKALDGAAAGLVDAGREYSMTAKIDTSSLGVGFPAQPDRAFTLKAGQTLTLTDLPIGAKVTISEARPSDDDVLTWAAPTIDPTTYTVAAADATTPSTITVTNHVTRTVGTFSIVKTVTGAQADNPAVPDHVVVTATWTQDGTPGSKTLDVPTDGTPVSLGENLLIGTQVTLTETPLADGSSIAWGAPVWSGTGVSVDGTSAVVTVGRDADARVALENHAATSTAGISLIKGIAGEAAGEVDDSTTFPVTATWVDADGNQQSKSLTINTTTPTSLGEDLPAGTVVTITEGKRPNIDTVVWGSITISGDNVQDAGDGSAQITASDQQGTDTLVTVVNEADWAPGTFSIAKHITGVSQDADDVPSTVTVEASWYEGDELSTKELTLPTDGTVVPFGADLPYGTQVTLTEVAPDGSPRFTWDAPVFSGDVTAEDDGSGVVTIGAATTAKVDLTNNATESLGSLEITKKVAGDGASKIAAGTKFPVTLSWTDLLGHHQNLDTTLVAGKTVTVQGVPLGTKVSIVEGDAKLPSGVQWKSVTWSAGGDDVTATKNGAHGATVTVTGDPGTVAALTATNTFDPRAVILADTGSDVTSWLVTGGVGAMLVAAGAALVATRRRRQA